jgi:hypothetical protein
MEPGLLQGHDRFAHLPLAHRWLSEFTFLQVTDDGKARSQDLSHMVSSSAYPESALSILGE